jgi:hypothetical protein
MPWERYDGARRRHSKTAAVRLAPNGLLHLNKAATDLLQGRTAALAYDRDDGRIRIRPSKAEYAARVGNQGQISARRFMKHFSIEPGRRWTIGLEGDALIGIPVEPITVADLE